jgi:DNA primase
MALFPQRFIDDLRLQANIVQVIQEYVPLKRAGRTFKGLCPFHSERTPSFHVDPDKGFFHCFGCQAGGDVFKFLELHEKVGFQDAVRMLAQKFGVAIPESTDDAPDDARRDASLREALLKVHEVASAYFREQLAGPAGVRARRQLVDRGVHEKTIDTLGLGYAVGGAQALKTRLFDAGFSQNVLLQSGLLVQRENGDLVDRFRNRLMVPISRDSGSVVAFGGRAMEAGQVPKYLNSPETPLYSKGRSLYGLNLTKSAIRQFGYVVLVEGYFDFAQVFQTQAAPVVASCGTALTAAQAQLLRRFATKVVLCYDPDAAGQSAAARSCELLVAEGFDVNVAVLDQGEDPDTFIRRRGPEQYRERLRRSRPYLEYLLEQAARGLDFRQDLQKRELLNRMLPVAGLLPSEAARDQFAEKVAFRAQITDEVVRSAFRKLAVKKRLALATSDLPSLGDLKKAERELISGLIHNTEQALQALDQLEPEDLESLAARQIFELARALHAQPPNLLPSTLLQRLSTGDAQLVTSIAASASYPAPPLECAHALKRLRLEREGAAIQREIDRLQELGAGQYGQEIDTLWQRKKDLLHQIEELQ